MTVRIPDLLKVILTATEAEAAAKATIARTRTALDEEARRRLSADGAAPTWKATGLGTVRYDEAGAWTPTVADPDRFASWVAEHYPTEAVATIELGTADQLEAALEALTFAGIAPTCSTVSVRPTFAAQVAENRLPDAAVDVVVEETTGDDGAVDRAITVALVDEATGVTTPVEGMGATRKPGRLVVSLDRDRRASALAAADEAATAAIEAAVEPDAATVRLDPAVVDERRRHLEGYSLDGLKAAAAGIDLATSGTKAALAERIARAQLLREAEHGPAIEHVEPLYAVVPDTMDATAALDARERLLAAAGGALTTASALPAPTRAVALQERTPMVTAHVAPDLTAEEAATVARFEAGPAAFPDDATSAANDALLAPGDIHPDALQVRALIALTGDQLKRACRAKGLPIAGSKATLAERLFDAGVTADTLT